jgi:glutamine amidotransferase
MIAIIDYGVGNLFSLGSSLEHLNIETIITKNPKEISASDKIILPGVGAFEDAMDKLKETGLVDLLMDQVAEGKPLLGICLGMQLLFEESHEYGCHKGLGLIKGTIASIQEDLIGKNGNELGLKVPHIGWNKLIINPGSEKDPIFKYFEDGGYVYYVHSFYGRDCGENTIASSNYDLDISGIVRNKNVYGMQFHPEKSGEAGLGLLKAWASPI